jgi:hypothetical protein
VKKETAEQLEAFRQQREAAEKALLDEAENQQKGNSHTISPPDQETWSTSGKKRRRLKEKDTLIGTKLRKVSSSADKDSIEKLPAKVGTEDRTDLAERRKEPAEHTEPIEVKAKSVSQEQSSPASRVISKTSAPTTTTTTPVTSALGLGDYSSDED